MEPGNPNVCQKIAWRGGGLLTGRCSALNVFKNINGEVRTHPGADPAAVTPLGLNEHRQQVSLRGKLIPRNHDTSPGAKVLAKSAPDTFLLIDDDFPLRHFGDLL
jgi:hypothetical protein